MNPISRMRGVLVFVLGMVVPAVVYPQQTMHTFVFDRVTVVDVERGKLIPDQRVVITGTRIQTVADVRATRIPIGARVVDARGKYLIPGLWDMHVHSMTLQQMFYPLFIANGITGVREMSSPRLDSLLVWKRAIAAGKRVGPRLLVTGGFLADAAVVPEWTPIFMRDYGGLILVGIATSEQARRVVDSLQGAGADFIKVRNLLRSPVLYFAAAAEARRVGIPLVGHLSDSVTALEAAAAGQRTIEHDPWRDCDASIALGDEAAVAFSFRPDARQRCAAVAEQLVRAGTWVTPTITVTVTEIASLIAAASGTTLAQPLEAFLCAPLSYWPDTLWEKRHQLAPWTAKSDPPILGRVKEAQVCARRPTLPHPQRAVAWTELPLLAGTDVVGDSRHITLVPGFSLHDELALLVAVGVSPLAALQAATLNPAKSFDAIDSLGTVTAGKVADLVLLDANPLENIRNTTSIRAVVANGRYFNRAALDTLLVQTDRAARRGKSRDGR